MHTLFCVHMDNLFKKRSYTNIDILTLSTNQAYIALATGEPLSSIVGSQLVVSMIFKST